MGGMDYIEKLSLIIWGPAAFRQRIPSVLFFLYGIRSTCTLINPISVLSLWVSVLYSSLHIDVLILYKYVYRDKQRLCNWKNDT